MSFNIYNENNTPAPAAEFLKAAKSKYGFVPNLLGIMAEAPALVQGYMTLNRIFDETSLTTTEKQVVLLAISFANGCAYCMAAHSAIAVMQSVPDDVIRALRGNSPIQDQKLETLRRLTDEIVNTRGHPSEDTVGNFLAAGYTHRQLLELVLGVGLKTLSNYTNHIARTPLDDAFERTAWRATDAA